MTKASIGISTHSVSELCFRGDWMKPEVHGYDYCDVVVARGRLFVSLVNDNFTDPMGYANRNGKYASWQEIPRG